MKETKRLGDKGENYTISYLRSIGYEIVEVNYWCRYGEIDIVALDRNDGRSKLVFVEVKARKTIFFGMPEESIARDKRVHMMKTIMHYLDNHNLIGSDIRVDVVGIQLNSFDEVEDLRHYRDVELF
ncbi:YraN family protein [Patescibacteria group bacterium]|nr:YraN family protein [Patescibacteria group bacterium]